MFFGDWLQRREMLSPNKVALIDALHDNQPVTYREWNRRSNQRANFLRDGLGIRKGDRVSIYAKNREVGRAIIVLKSGASLTPTDLRNWLRARMAHYKVPKSVVFVDTFPKTGANKVDKPKLIEQYGS